MPTVRVPAVPSETPGRPSLNHPPTIELLNIPQDVIAGETVALSVVASDADGDELAYQWEIVSVNTNSGLVTDTEEVMLHDADQANATLVTGKRTTGVALRVGVRDPYAATISDAVQLGFAMNSGLRVTLQRDKTGSASMPYYVDSYSSFDVFQGEVLAIQSNISPFEYTLDDRRGSGWSVNRDGEQSLTVTVPSDPLGQAWLTITAGSQNVNLWFNVANRAPVIDALVYPSTMQTGETASVQVMAHDPDGDTLYYRFSQSSSTGAWGRISGKQTASSTCPIATKVTDSYQGTVEVMDSYGLTTSQAITFDVTNAWRLLYRSTLDSDELTSIAVDSNTLLVGHFQTTDSSTGAGTSYVDRLDLASGIATPSLTRDVPPNSWPKALPSFRSDSPTILQMGSQFYTYAAQDIWTAIDVPRPCDTTPALVQGSSLFAVSTCQSDIVVQSQTETGWVEQWRYPIDTSFRNIDAMASVGQSVWLALRSLASSGSSDRLIRCDPSTGCAQLAEFTFKYLSWVDTMAVDNSGTVYLVTDESPMQLWQVNAAGVTALATLPEYSAGLLASENGVYLARTGSKSECDSIDCTVVAMFDGTTWTNLGSLAGICGTNQPLLARRNNVLYLGRKSSPHPIEVYAIELGSKSL